MNIYHRTTTNESKRTNMTELVDDRSSCSVCIVLRHSQYEPNETMLLIPGLKCRHKEEAYFYNHMACKKRVVSKYVAVTNLAIMSDVTRAHD